MSFLFPLYLLGAAAIAVPILLHLRRRPPKEHVPFGSLMFLEKSPERLTRRTRLERWLLLALRCLAIILLALAFGRPFLQSMTLPTESSTFSRAVILVDRSASMHREDLWQQALSEANKAIERFDGGDEVAFAFYDEEFDLIAGFPAWEGLGARARAAALEEKLSESNAGPSWLGTDTGTALTRAADLLLTADTSNPANEREIVLIGDLQNGSDLDSLKQNAWPEEVSLRCIAVEAKENGNFSATLAATPPRSNVDEEEVYRVRIGNAADSDEAKANLMWKGFPESAIETTVAPGTSRILTSPPRPSGAERGVLTVIGDKHPFDNEVYISPVQPRPLRVVFVNERGVEETAGSPLFYLRRALQRTPVLNPVVSSADSLTENDLAANEVVLLAGEWSPDTGKKVREFAEKGGLAIALPSADTASDSFAALTEDDWKLSEFAVDDYSLLADVDFDHPVLQPFARAQIRDFTKIRFWKHRRLEWGEEPGTATRVVATFDGKAPALVEHRVGEGAIFAFLSGWEPRESQLALSSKFVPLLFSIFDHAGYSIRSAPTLYVGETEHQKPGFYPVSEEGSTYLTAVNLNPAEGRTAPFDPAVTFGALGIPLLDESSDADNTGLTPEMVKRLESEQKEERQKLWKWLILGALALLIVETWLAGRRGARRTSAITAGSPAATPS